MTVEREKRNFKAFSFTTGVKNLSKTAEPRSDLLIRVTTL